VSHCADAVAPSRSELVVPTLDFLPLYCTVAFRCVERLFHNVRRGDSAEVYQCSRLSRNGDEANPCAIGVGQRTSVMHDHVPPAMANRHRNQNLDDAWREAVEAMKGCSCSV